MMKIGLILKKEKLYRWLINWKVFVLECFNIVAIQVLEIVILYLKNQCFGKIQMNLILNLLINYDWLLE